MEALRILNQHRAGMTQQSQSASDFEAKDNYEVKEVTLLSARAAAEYSKPNLTYFSYEDENEIDDYNSTTFVDWKDEHEVTTDEDSEKLVKNVSWRIDDDNVDETSVIEGVDDSEVPTSAQYRLKVEPNDGNDAAQPDTASSIASPSSYSYSYYSGSSSGVNVSQGYDVIPEDESVASADDPYRVDGSKASYSVSVYDASLQESYSSYSFSSYGPSTQIEAKSIASNSLESVFELFGVKTSGREVNPFDVIGGREFDESESVSSYGQDTGQVLGDGGRTDARIPTIEQVSVPHQSTIHFQSSNEVAIPADKDIFSEGDISSDPPKESLGASSSRVDGLSFSDSVASGSYTATENDDCNNNSQSKSPKVGNEDSSGSFTGSYETGSYTGSYTGTGSYDSITIGEDSIQQSLTNSQPTDEIKIRQPMQQPDVEMPTARDRPESPTPRDLTVIVEDSDSLASETVYPVGSAYVAARAMKSTTPAADIIPNLSASDENELAIDIA